MYYRTEKNMVFCILSGMYYIFTDALIGVCRGSGQMVSIPLRSRLDSPVPGRGNNSLLMASVFFNFDFGNATGTPPFTQYISPAYRIGVAIYI